MSHRDKSDNVYQVRSYKGDVILRHELWNGEGDDAEWLEENIIMFTPSVQIDSKELTLCED